MNTGVLVGFGKDGGAMAMAEYEAVTELSDGDIFIFPSDAWHGAVTHPDSRWRSS